MIVHMGSRAVRWVVDEDTGDLHGVGEHATYVVHQLIEHRTGQDPVRGRFYAARKLGENPLKVVGGPYDTADQAKSRAESLEASL